MKKITFKQFIPIQDLFIQMQSCSVIIVNKYLIFIKDTVINYEIQYNDIIIKVLH